jgi:AbrB family looped-hinge helix DNA binding protein
MRATIDKAGRIVIPAALRDRAGFVAGSEIEISEDDRGLRLERVAAGPRLVRIGKRLVARPTVRVEARPVIDIATVVDEERNRWP